MAPYGVSAVNLSIDALAFAIAGVSLYFVARQKPSQYPYLKSLLVLVHALFEVIVLLDAGRNLVNSPGYIGFYSILAPTLVFWESFLLTVIAYFVYLRPGGRGAGPRLRSLFLRWPHGSILAAFVVFISAAVAYTAYFRPYTLVLLSSIGGGQVLSPQYNQSFLLISVANLLFFMAYPTILLIRATSQVRDAGARRRLMVLPFCWVGIGAEILFFNGYLVTVGYDYIALGYILASLLFGVTAAIFRRASLLSTFFSPVVGLAVPSGPLPEGEEAALDASIPVLFEVDPTTNYETALAGLAKRKASSGGLVYVFTSRGSNVHHALAAIPGVRLYLMTSQVSYPGPGERENELLIPQNDMAIMLDLLDKTVSSTGDTPLALVFDSVSDFMLYVGFESTYKFLKQANEILGRPRVSAVYLVTLGAHEDRVMSLTKSLFRKHLVFDRSGIKVTREWKGGASAQGPGG